MQLSPHPSLRGLVKHYLILDHNVSKQHYRMFSDGNPGIVFHLKDPLLEWNEGNLIPKVQSMSFVYGQLTHYNTISANGHLNMIVVVLQPYSLFTHFHTSACELNDNSVPLEDLFGQQARDLEEQVITALTIDNAIWSIEKFLLKQTIQSSQLTTDIALAMDVIYQHQGIITIENLLATVPVTERQLERKFREYIGTTPKRFADIIKFQHLLKLLQKQPDKKKIAELIYKSGYYDQAHLNKNFRRMTGLTPTHYKDTSQMLAINLMPVN